MLFVSEKTSFDCYSRFKLSLAVCLFLFILIGAPISSLAKQAVGEPYTLTESVAQALRSSPRVLSSDYALAGAKAEAKMAQAQMLPSLTLSGGRNYVRNDYSEGLVDSDYLSQYTDTLGLRVTQTLFAGLSLLNNYQRAQLQKELKAAEKTMVEDRLILEVQTGFFDLLKARGDVRTIEGSTERLKTTVESARTFTELRLAPYADLLQAEADLDDAIQRLSKARIAEINLGVNLSTLLGLDADASVSYVGGFKEQILTFPWSLEQCLERAMKHRSELKVARLSVEVAEKAAEVVRGRSLPKVDLQAGYLYQERAYDNDNVTVNRDYSTGYWSAGVNFQWKMFDGSYNHYDQQRAISDVRRQREELRSTRNRVFAQVLTFFKTLQESRERIAATRKGLESAHENLQRARERFKVRVGTVVELLEAQARLTRAETNNGQAVADYQQILANLLFSIGERNPSLRF